MAADCIAQGWTDVRARAAEEASAALAVAMRRAMPAPRRHRYSSAGAAPEHCAPRGAARSVLDSIRSALRHLDNSGFRRSRQQRKFHEAFLRAAIRSIYKTSYDDLEESIKKEQKWDDIGKDVLVVTPRRFGKTFAVALFCAAYCVCVPGCEVGIFSTCQRASKKLLDLVRQFVAILQAAQGREWPSCKIHTSNAEKLVLSPRSDEFDMRTIHSYPACTKQLQDFDRILSRQLAAVEAADALAARKHRKSAAGPASLGGALPVGTQPGWVHDMAFLVEQEPAPPAGDQEPAPPLGERADAIRNAVDQAKKDLRVLADLCGRDHGLDLEDEDQSLIADFFVHLAGATQRKEASFATHPMQQSFVSPKIETVIDALGMLRKQRLSSGAFGLRGQGDPPVPGAAAQGAAEQGVHAAALVFLENRRVTLLANVADIHAPVADPIADGVRRAGAPEGEDAAACDLLQVMAGQVSWQTNKLKALVNAASHLQNGVMDNDSGEVGRHMSLLMEYLKTFMVYKCFQVTDGQFRAGMTAEMWARLVKQNWTECKKYLQRGVHVGWQEGGLQNVEERAALSTMTSVSPATAAQLEQLAARLGQGYGKLDNVVWRDMIWSFEDDAHIDISSERHFMQALNKFARRALHGEASALAEAENHASGFAKRLCSELDRGLSSVPKLARALERCVLPTPLGRAVVRRTAACIRRARSGPAAPPAQRGADDTRAYFVGLLRTDFDRTLQMATCVLAAMQKTFPRQWMSRDVFRMKMWEMKTCAKWWATAHPAGAPA